MPKQRIAAIEYIRGISALGVIAIHTGAYSLSNPELNIHLFAALEIFTRFSIPVFFFISAFGLFINQNLSQPFDYRSFLIRRTRTILFPYITWSLIYMCHYTWYSGDSLIWSPPLVYEFFLFGLASYQLYFLVILFWFYILMPLWRFAVQQIIKKPVVYLSVILVLQILINYYSSYMLQPNFENYYINLSVQYRLSHWVIHYTFIFLFGAVCAVKYSKFLQLLIQYRRTINTMFCITLAGILSYYYYLIYFSGYNPEGAVNTDHQLSPIGTLYTATAAVFWFNLFKLNYLPQPVTKLLGLLGDYSYLLYLVHPLIMQHMVNTMESNGLIMTDMVVLAFYLLTIGLSLLLGCIIRSIGGIIPLISMLLTGTNKK